MVATRFAEYPSLPLKDLPKVDNVLPVIDSTPELYPASRAAFIEK
jgi:hypothetical protein